MDYERVLEVLRALLRESVDYVLVGAVAMGIQGIDRLTRDLDIFVAPNPDNIEKLKKALYSVWSDSEIEGITAQDLAGEYPTIRYAPPDGSFFIDLMSRLGEAIRYEDLAWEVLEVEGVAVCVATPATLYRMKRDTIRPQDRVDASNLKRKFRLEG